MISYAVKSLLVLELQLGHNACQDEEIRCNVVSPNSALTIDIIYRKRNITKAQNGIIEKVIKYVNQSDCVIMADFNHRDINRDH